MAARSLKLKRELKLSWTPNPNTGAAAAFLWGPRQTGKTTLLHEQFPAARFYDLLDTALAAELSIRPRTLREQTLADRPEIVVIDAVQKVPDLLEEVHWLLENVARETNVSAATVRSYFQILEDTLLGFTLEPWRKARKRRLVETAKFYLFDIGVANHLNPEASTIVEGTDLFGRAFEHFLLNEVCAYLAYRGQDRSLAFWRTSSGYEVDLIVSDLELALEFKVLKRTREADLRGVRALLDEHRVRRAVVVSREERPRTTEDGIEIVPWQVFCQRLWDGDLI